MPSAGAFSTFWATRLAGTKPLSSCPWSSCAPSCATSWRARASAASSFGAGRLRRPRRRCREVSASAWAETASWAPGSSGGGSRPSRPRATRRWRACAMSRGRRADASKRVLQCVFICVFICFHGFFMLSFRSRSGWSSWRCRHSALVRLRRHARMDLGKSGEDRK